MNLKDFRATSLKFRRIASNMLRPDRADNAIIYLLRFKDFIDSDPIVRDIVDNAISNTQYDHHMYFFEDSYWMTIKPPINPKEHLRAQYDLITALCESKANISSIAHRIPRGKGTNSKESVSAFMGDLFGQIVDFITDSLSEEIMIMEEETKGGANINVGGNFYGTANQAQGDITSTNIVYASNVNDIITLIESLRLQIASAKIDDDMKEDILDDMETIEEEIKKDAPKSTRLKKALAGINGFITSTTSGTIASVALITNLQELAHKVAPFIERFQSIT